MVIAEATERVDTFKELWNIINANKLAGWTVLSAFPEVSPTFPCIVLNPIDIDSDILSMDRTVRENVVSFDIELFAKASDHKIKLDQGKDNIMATLRDPTNRATLKTAKLDITDISDAGSDEGIFDGMKINSGTLSVEGVLLL